MINEDYEDERQSTVIVSVGLLIEFRVRLSTQTTTILMSFVSLLICVAKMR